MLIALKTAAPATAQVSPQTTQPASTQAQLNPTEESRPPRPPIEPETIPEVQPPPLEIDPELSEPTDEGAQSSPEDVCLPLATSEETRFDATDIEVVGSTVLQTEIAQRVACYEGKTITLSDLFNLRSQITQLYIDNGYVTSGAFIPNGQLLEGTILVQVIEGNIEEIQVNGLPRLREGYVTSRVSGTSAPLNQEDLRESLQLLQLDPNIQTVNAELTAGSQPGESLLILDLDEPKPFDILTSTDNLRSPSIGSIGANLSASYRNLVGIGDVISASYGLTEGLDLYSIDLSTRQCK